MNILVTGGLGFIGSNFIKHLSSKNHTIYNIDKIGIGANPKNLRDLEDKPNYTFIKGDITDSNIINNLISHVDVIVNFAAETHVDRSIVDPKSFIDSNYLGTFVLLEAERNTSKTIRHVQVSTDEVYGDTSEGSCTEDDALNPSNPYAATKASADLLCKAYRRTYGMDILVTRCTNNFGPYQYPEKLIPKTIIRALHDLKIPVYGTGEALRDWLYVLDHCYAIELVMNKGKSGEIYNVSAGNEIPVIDIVKQILDLLDKPEDMITFVNDRPGHDLRYSLDSTKLRTTLGWKAKYSFNKALLKTVEWYVKKEQWWKPIINDKTLHSTPWET